MPELMHLDERAIARYVDGAVDNSDRAVIESHLADCDECRSELVAVRGILASSPRRRWGPLLPLAAAAVLLLVIRIQGDHRRGSDASRGSESPGGRAPIPIAPVDTVAELNALLWHPVSGALRYRATIAAQDGRVRWQATTSDTSLGVPDSVGCVPLTPYYWRIAAEVAMGRWEESPPAGFVCRAVTVPR